MGYNLRVKYLMALKPEAKRAYMREYHRRPEVKKRRDEYAIARYKEKREEINAYQRRWRSENEEYRREKHRKWRAQNKELVAAKARAYYLANRERLIARQKERDARNKEHVQKRKAAYAHRTKSERRIKNLAYMNRRNREDVSFNLQNRLRCRLYSLLKKGGVRKTASALLLVGCPLADLRVHIEKQFVGEMAWDNFGQWELDHIRPCCSFDFRNEAEQRACFHYSNLRPLWRADNRRKTQEDRKLSIRRATNAR